MQEEQYADLYWDREPAEKEKFIAQLAPIVLFTYNRLKHTKQTIEALQENVYASDSELFIYSDAPKTDKAVAEVQAVRDYLHSINGFKKITIIEREENWGLARNIIDGVTSIVNKYGKIIVLEDDIVTSKYFLKYMNDALKVYRNHEKVMAISAFFSIDDQAGLPDSFFIKHFMCWGWATWDRAWRYYDRSPEKIRRIFQLNEIKDFDLHPYSSWWQQIVDNCNGKLFTWAIFFSAAIYLNKGLVHYSKYNFCSNIGLDGSGEHCGKQESKYKFLLSTKKQELFSLKVEEDAYVLSVLYKYFARQACIYRRILNIYNEFGILGLIKKCFLKISFYR